MLDISYNRSSAPITKKKEKKKEMGSLMARIVPNESPSMINEEQLAESASLISKRAKWASPRPAFIGGLLAYHS